MLLDEHVVTVCPLEFVVLPLVVPVAHAVSPGLLMIVVLFVVVVVHVPPEQLVVPLCVVVVDEPSGFLTSVVPLPGAGASLGLSLPVGAQTLTPLISPGACPAGHGAGAGLLGEGFDGVLPVPEQLADRDPVK